MKQWYCLFLLLPFQYLVSCPTCMGRLSASTPTPFFSDEHYKPHTQAHMRSQGEAETETTHNEQDEERPDTSEDLLP